MIRKIIALLASLVAIAGMATGCTSTAEAKPTPSITTSKSSEVQASTPTASPSLTPTPTATPVSDEELLRNQREKFAYLQDPARITMFEQSGYETAKVMLAKDVLAGKYGTPEIKNETAFNQPIWIVTVGSSEDAQQLFANFIIHLDEAGQPDYAKVFNLGLRVPDHSYVSILNKVHDWPTEIDGQSVDLLYSVSYGNNWIDLVADTCLWPQPENERQFCYDRKEGTKTARDAAILDQMALRLMDTSMMELYGPDWKN